MHIGVVGGGLMGWSTAFHLAERGMDVVVIDAVEPGWATGAGAGIISGETTRHLSEVYFETAVLAGQYYPELVARLGGEAAVGYSTCPLLEVCLQDDNRERFLQRSRLVLKRNQARRGQVEALSPQKVAQLCPALAPVQGALIHWGAARVDGRQLTRQLSRQARRLGARSVQGRVDRVLAESQRVTGVMVDGSPQAFDAVVIACGAWSARLVSFLGVHLPIEPQRGQILHLAGPDGADQWPTIVGMRGHYCLPFADGRVVVGATRETGSGFSPILTAAGQAEVIREALRVLPVMADCPVLEWRVGIRPVSADQMPILGAVPGWTGLHLATGHGAGGLLMGPYTTKLVADAILDPRAAAGLGPFSLKRFAR